MSLLRPKLPRLAFVAMSLILMGVLVAAPSVSGAKAAVKQFTATIAPDTAIGGVAATWTERVKNCGTPIAAPCTASSTIAIGQIPITVPPEFRSQPDFSVSVIASNGSTWTALYDSGVITAQPDNGSNKLNSGEFVDITVNAIPECISGPKEFTTTAVGGLPNGPNNQTFALVSPSQPSVTIVGCALESGGTVTDPVTGQTETISGDFQGRVFVTFGGNTADCSFDPVYGAQWFQYHLPTQVGITPDPDTFVAGTDPKISTSEFDQTFFGGDSSWYLICYAVPIDDAHPLPFETIGGGTATDRTIDGVHYWVGILASCDEAVAPCVLEQFLTTGAGSPPWDPANSRIHIAIEIPPNDPYKR